MESRTVVVVQYLSENPNVKPTIKNSHRIVIPSLCGINDGEFIVVSSSEFSTYNLVGNPDGEFEPRCCLWFAVLWWRLLHCAL